tara:strand:- start:764 stop:1405 length:642 start_codon:yes stop_codon:yes gene_type:complete
MSIKLNISLQETQSEIAALISREVFKMTNRSFSRSVKPIKQLVKQELGNSVRNQPEWSSLLGGKLRTEFGIPDAFSRLSQVLNIWLSNIQVEFHRMSITGTKMSGGLTIRAVQDNYEDVLSLADSSFVTEKGEELEWLRWLLVEGDRTIIRDYHIQYGQKGRAGPAIMIKKGRWKVPSEFAGNPNNNFVTRAINQIDSTLQKEIAGIITNNGN